MEAIKYLDPFQILLHKLDTLQQDIDYIKSRLPEAEEKYYSVKEAQKLLNLSDQTIRAYIEQGHIIAEQTCRGGKIRIPESQFRNGNLQKVKSLKFKR